MGEVIELGGAEEVASRPFTAPAHTTREASVMQAMLTRMRVRAPVWLEGEERDILVRAPDADGRRHWIRIPDRDALVAAPHLTVVGFFGDVRDDIDQTLIHDLEEAIVATLEWIPGVLSYYDLELPEGGYGNLILCDDAAAPSRVQDHELHRRAVELTPRHYRTVRLHTGAVAGPLVSEEPLTLSRTRYYDFGGEEPWLAVRDAG
jgi:hypothetical protein